MGALLTLADDLLLGLDPVRFSQAAGIEPDPWQAQLLRSSAPRILVNCSRQSGKSTTAATLAVHTAIYQPGALVLLISRALRQSAELFRKCLDVWAAIGRPVETEAENRLSLELDTGSRIVSLPGKEETIRGYSGVALLIADESSRVPDQLYYSLRPMLAVSGGRLIALSSPFGTRGWWYEAWRSREAWERYEVPADQCPRISPDFLAEEKRTMGAWWYAQEYDCQFLDAQTSVFRQADIDAMFSERIEQWSL